MRKRRRSSAVPFSQLWARLSRGCGAKAGAPAGREAARKEEVVEREFFAGFIKIHILYHAAHEAICGTDITKELARHGYSVSPGTLYPTLHRLEKLGYLAREERVSGGRRRKYYTATPSGRKALRVARERISELVSEVVEGE